ncbi:MAG: CCXG family PEP-CTERM protein [Gammaproteobacteria bacterium]
MPRLDFFASILLSAVMVSGAANAGEIIFETRATNNEVMPWDALGSWQAQSSPVTASELLEFTNVFTPGSQRHSRLQLQFDATGADLWEFEFGLDAGFGAAIYLNDELATSNGADLWWGYNWNASDQLLRLSSNLFMDGINTIDVYWAENCCAGGQSGRFRTDSGSWRALSTANLNQVAEPGSIALLTAGLGGLVAARRQRRAAKHKL